MVKPNQPNDLYFRFTGTITAGKVGMQIYFVHFPYDVQALFGTRGRVRMVGTLNGLAVERALIPDGTGGHLIMLSLGILRQLKLRCGDPIDVDFRRDERPDHQVDLPEELQAALELDPEQLRRFEELTPGYRRSLAYWVNSAKSIDTRVKRALELVKRLENGTLKRNARKREHDE